MPVSSTPPTTISPRVSVLSRVTVVSVFMAGIGAVLLLLPPQISRADLPLHLPLLLIFVLFVMAATTPFNLEVGRNGFALSLTEVPIVLGLLSTGRLPLALAGSLAFLVSKIRDSKVASIKLIFNVPLAFAEISAAVFVFDVFGPTKSISSPRTWAELAVALAFSTVLSTSAVNAIIIATGDRLSAGQALRHSLLGVINALMALGLTITAVLLISITPVAALLVVLLAALVVAPLRRYATLQRRFASLQSLHDYTAGLTRSKNLGTTLESAANQAARILRAESAEIVLTRVRSVVHRAGTPSSEDLPPTDGDEVWLRVLIEDRAVLFAKGAKEGHAYLARYGGKDLMAVPMRHDDEVIGLFVVRDRQGDVSTFDRDDLAILQTMADQTTITLQNLKLIDRLRDEAATREHQALHDDLTGLANRSSLARKIQEGIDLSDGIAKFAILLLDLNRFKDVNDTLGHHAGDRVLVEVGRRLVAALPRNASVARLGGDEFAITLPDVRNVDEACVAAENFQKAFLEPFDIDGMALRLDASIGVSVFPDHGLDRNTLMQRADVAMYAAKVEKGGAVKRYDPSQEQSTMRQLTLVADLRTAVDSGEIVVLFQPKADLDTGAFVGVESLARWKHATYGPISPDEFIPLAERAGLIGDLTDHVLRRSLEECGRWHERDLALSIAVNLDATTLAGPGFVPHVASLLATYGVAPTCLTFEITEREIVREIDLASSRMNELRTLGVRFSIDDFGTGYSSLAYLSRLPVDEVKIDRSFAGDAADSRRHAALVRAITDIAGNFGLTTVAEGVEDARCWETLRDLGCDVAQGWHLARPLSSEDLWAWFRHRPGARDRRSATGGAPDVGAAKPHSVVNLP